MYYVYVLRNPKGILYKGQSDDLQKRIQQHNNLNDDFAAFTKKRGPWTLVYQEDFESREEAKARERFLKTGKGRAFLTEKLSKTDAARDL